VRGLSGHNFSLGGGPAAGFQRPSEAAQQVGTCEPPHRFHSDFPSRLPERARSVKAKRSDNASVVSRVARLLWSPLSPASLEFPGLDGSLVACRPERHSGHGKPDRVSKLGGPLFLSPVAEMLGTGDGSLGAGFHRVKKEGRPFPACPWFKPLNWSGRFRRAPRCPV
jgi:hypothetical protein